jgi:preprotein translocase subunit SecF
MELFKNTNYDFLGKKWPFIIASLVLSVAGLSSLALKGGPRYGIDFRGGALMDVRFAHEPPVQKLRSALSKRISGDITVQQLTGGNSQEVLIGTELKAESELNDARKKMVDTLDATFGQPGGKLDFNNSGSEAIALRLRDALPRNNVSLSDQQLQDLVTGMLKYRDSRSGIVNNFAELSKVAGVTPAVLTTLQQECYLAPYAIRSAEMVGPKVGADLRRQAVLATLYALGGMLVYIAFRFEWIYGVAAVVAVFHDTIITVGLFSIFNKDIDLTVVAALLTLVGYSMNDTIVVFDRIRENLKILRREKLEALINKSVNQTLSRTILTSGLTFLTVIALFLFGGQVLHGFSFALVCGITIGTYSSVFVASPILVFWQDFLESRKRRPPSAPAPVKESAKAAKRAR